MLAMLLVTMTITTTTTSAASWPIGDDVPIQRFEQFGTRLFVKNTIAWFETSTIATIDKLPEVKPANLPFDEHFVEVMDIRAQPDALYWLVRTHFGLRFYKETTSTTAEIELPTMVQTLEGRARVAVGDNGDDYNIAIMGNGVLHYKNENTTVTSAWKVLQVPPKRLHYSIGNLGARPWFVYWQDKQIYLGYNPKFEQKEVTAGLFKYDPREDEFSAVFENDNLPINDIQVSGSTRWIASGAGPFSAT